MDRTTGEARSRASLEYWDDVWRDRSLPKGVDPRRLTWRNRTERHFDRLFREVLGAQPGRSLVELGCARSVWLPYFAKEHGLHVTGIDYSKDGCAQARAILAKEGVAGDVMQADVFAPPPGLLGRFDFVVSFGLVEHFEDTPGCLGVCASFLRPGGTMMTVIPNMKGLVGCLQKTLGREVYDVHIPLDIEELRAAHERAGLRVVSCAYFCSLELGVVNLTRFRRTLLGLWASRLLNAFSAAVGVLERVGLRLPASRAFSPYVVCVARRA